jgi:hypothetical protein
MLKLHNYQQKSMTDIQDFLGLPENRKKTINTLLAREVIKDLVTDFYGKDHSNFQFDFILCTGDGELNQTFQFYQNLALKNYARPILFQNSLHNSTLGALSLEVSGMRLGMSISNGCLSYENGIDLALNRPTELPVIIVGVDSYPKELIDMKSKSYDGHVRLTNGACGALFTKVDKLEDGIIIGKIQYKFETDNDNKREFVDFYPSNGLLDLVRFHSSTKSSFAIQRPNNTEVIYYSNNELN